MAQNRSITGTAEAVERTKNAGGEMTEEMRNRATEVAERAQRAYEDTSEMAYEFADETYDRVGEMFRSGEEFVRRRPVSSLAVAAAVAFVAGYLMRR